MKRVVVVIFLTIFSFITLQAEDNKTAKKFENNATIQAEKQLQEQIEREKKFAKEQTFYKGQDYDLSYAEVDSNSLDNIHVEEPDYDFNMDDVYD